MFPFQRSCDLSFKVDSEDNPSEQDIEDEILLPNNALLGVTNTINTGRGRGRGRGRSRGRRSVSLASSSNTNSVINDNDEEEKKRVFHREIERQRRMEMSSLFDSLRSVIPANDSKGRKSITDQLEEATNYIKDLEKNVKELGDKRDQLKHSIQSSNSGRYELGGSSGSSAPYTVVLRQFVGGLEIEISVKYDDTQFLLSTAIQVALEEGLDVVSSTSAKFHERFIHSMQCEINDVRCIDLNRLEQRLNDLFHRSGDDQ